jgi:hypothetical protein
MEMSVELNDFQKRFLLGQGAGQQLFTAKEFDEHLAQAKAEIMAVAIETTKQAIGIEREACAKVAHFMQLNDARIAGVDVTNFKSPIAEAIFTRLSAKAEDENNG